MRVFLVIVTVLLSAAPLQTDDLAAQIDTYLSEQASRFPGMAVGVVHQGEVILTAGYGTLEADTPILIGSVSKPLTAAGVMLLAEQGLIDLDEPVQSYIPYFEPGDDITVRMLLNQNGGLGEAGYRQQAPNSASIEEGVRALASAAPTALPGEQFQYFNPNYTTLGHLIEVVSGQPYADYMAEHIYEPLGMTSTSAASEVTAPGHIPVFGLPVQVTPERVEWGTPSGWTVSTAQDMARFVQMNLSGDLLTAETLTAMHTAAPNQQYGLGWFEAEIDGVPVVTHGGDLPGYHADITLVPGEEVGWVLLYDANSLAYNLTVFPQVEAGLLAIVQGGEAGSASALPVYLGLLALIGVTAAGDIRRLTRMEAWQAKFADKRRATANAVSHFVLPVAVIVGLPPLITALGGRLVTWETILQLMPEVVLWVALTAPLSVAVGVIKLLRLRKLTES